MIYWAYEGPIAADDLAKIEKFIKDDTDGSFIEEALNEEQEKQSNQEVVHSAIMKLTAEDIPRSNLDESYLDVEDVLPSVRVIQYNAIFNKNFLSIEI